MGAKTKFKIDYTIDKKELVEKVEKKLISEGWEKTNYTYPNDIKQVKATDIFTTWFEREWE